METLHEVLELPLNQRRALFHWYIVRHLTGQGSDNIGALIIRIGFWSPLYDTYNKEPLE